MTDATSARLSDPVFALEDAEDAAEFYRAHGFVGFADVFDDDACGDVRSAIERAASARVDTDDPSGAFGLYEQMGFRSVNSVVMYGKTLPDGTD